MGLASSAFTSGSFGFAFGLTLLAGLATGVGSALAFFATRTNLRLLAQTLAFSAGVMLYVSFMEILPESSVHLARHFGARTGLAVAAAVALHNIPEGISVSVPIFYATGRRGRAFTYSLLTGLSEPLGGLLAAVALGWFLPDYAVGLVFASVAGVMVYVSIDELLPTAHRCGRSHEILACIAGGMAVMAVSLQLLG